MTRFFVVSMVVASIVVLEGQQPAPSAPNQSGLSIFGSAAEAVVIDVVVRDSKGRPVTGLRKGDFTLLEDGVPQQIGDLVEVAPRQPGAKPAPTLPTDTPAEPARQQPAITTASPRFQAIVFDHLSDEARARAYKGALAALDTLEDGDFVGVFLADQTLVTLQTYTNDRRKLEAAIREVAKRASTRLDRASQVEDLRNRDDRGNPLPGDADPSVPVVASAESEGRPVDGRTILSREIKAVLDATSNSWDTMRRAQQGYTTTNALIALTSGLGVLPGRKSVVFFSEGLPIPDEVLAHFRNVVATANRANVSFYTIDSAGLRVHSTFDETGRAVRAMGAAGFAGASDLRMLEGNEMYLKSDPRTSLTMLAERTGGFLVESTNDLADAFRRADLDRRFYYLLTYAPKNAALDGAWRTVSVAVPDRKVDIRARTGYLAVPGAATVPMLAYEAPALAALDRQPAPTTLPVHARSFVFPRQKDARLAILASTDGSALTFAESDGRFRTDFTILARIRDSTGAVVRKASQPYRLTGPADQIDRAKRGDILFFRQPSLPPGTYTLEVAVHDALSGTDGVERLPLAVPSPATSGLSVSSLVLIRRAEPVGTGERQPDNPFYLDDVVLYPNLGEPLPAGRDLSLACFLEIAGARSAPDVEMALLEGERQLAHGPLQLPPPDASGRIRYLGQIAVGASLDGPGDYVLRLTIGQGAGRVMRDASFRVAP